MTLDFNIDEPKGIDDLIKNAERNFYFSGGKEDPDYKSPQEYLKDWEEFD